MGSTTKQIEEYLAENSPASSKEIRENIDRDISKTTCNKKIRHLRHNWDRVEVVGYDCRKPLYKLKMDVVEE
ncbi:MAG: hypothetical protein MUP58_03150 [Candidatus Nanohaloarchaeota archaeon QJJ-9]|nr:hypothetical protein [Candidatus Nanohaloarchaeota archaeon QJJ-9]